jgi:hypothetical protein
MLHICALRRHHEIHQTLSEEGGGEREKWRYNGGVNLVKVHCTHAWNYHNESLHVLLMNIKTKYDKNKYMFFKIVSY